MRTASAAGLVDLHTHTTASDGDLSPRALVEAAAAAEVTTLAVTDHDTMAGVPEAMEAAAQRAVTLIPAVELSVQVPRGSMHLLGYFAEPAPPQVCRYLEAAGQRRRDRAEEIVARLAALGVPVDFDEVCAQAAGNVGRPHIADALVAAGHCSSRADAFRRYLNDHGPAYVGYEALTPVEAIRLIRDDGGVAVLAHPYSLGVRPGELMSAVQRLAARGLGGIEVHRPEYDAPQRRRYARMAAAFRLLGGGGSDFHGPGRGYALGNTGDPPLPAAAADRLQEALATAAR